ncbi:MAG: hypothetical protein AAF752_00140 [Bacteroidota bacterium]
MLDLAASVVCSVVISTLFKLGVARGYDRIWLITTNYAVAFTLGAVVLGEPIVMEDTSPAFWTLAFVTGALFIYTYVVFAWATGAAGMALATGVMRLSVAIPVAVSWLVFAEVPSGRQTLGLGVAAVAFVLLSWTPADEQARAERGGKALLALGVLFVMGGMVDTSLKAFDVLMGDVLPGPAFAVVVYGIALGFGVLMVAYRRVKPNQGVIVWGVVLGVFNYGSLFFLLRALRHPDLTGPVLFPLNSIGVVLGAALVGVLFWEERLDRKNWIGLAVAGAALVLIAG